MLDSTRPASRGVGSAVSIRSVAVVNSIPRARIAAYSDVSGSNVSDRSGKPIQRQIGALETDPLPVRQQHAFEVDHRVADADLQNLREFGVRIDLFPPHQDSPGSRPWLSAPSV